MNKKFIAAILAGVVIFLGNHSAFANSGFFVKKIDDTIFSKIKGKSFKDNCTLPVEDLRYLHVLHKDLNGNTLEGEIICSAYIADDLLDIFQKLYQANYPVEKIRLVDEYNADDEISMRDNNSSCFNFRFISHTKRISKHGLGLAVDINTLYNSYIKYLDDGTRVLEPATAEIYPDREKNFPYKITEHGFEWGGNWSDRKDYQHFEISSDIVKLLYPNDF